VTGDYLRSRIALFSAFLLSQKNMAASFWTLGPRGAVGAASRREEAKRSSGALALRRGGAGRLAAPARRRE